MENLNDVEFGSDKSGEEAPILVAQRYLNIFRQVHIFNKAKRDEFDDELLALPQNITDFFKRMPGGRLLVEHIEQVKTDRGIAFVKANKEDFDEGAGKTDNPKVTSGDAVQTVSGNITIDASFADALAQALANAFKQLPQSPISSSGTVSTITADFGNAFDVIAEEIRTSRASLLDVLKETRSITDSVIASQVSISRILEGILATRDRDDTDIADLNNRIIASQASITKLLEGLYTASNKKNAEISEYLNVENRLRRFREEITSDLDISLQKMQELFRLCAQSLQDRKVIIDNTPSGSDSSISVNIPDKNINEDHESITSANISNTSEIAENLSQEKHSPHVEPENLDNIEFTSPLVTNQSTLEQKDSNYPEFQEHKKKKKKKKKKNRSEELSDEHLKQQIDTDFVTNESVAERGLSSVSDLSSTTQGKNSSVAQSSIPAFDGIIRNDTFKHEDNFDNVRLDVPPLDSDGSIEDSNVSSSHYSSTLEKQSNVAISDNIDVSTKKHQPEKNLSIENDTFEDLDFMLPDISDDHHDNTEKFSNIGHISNLDNSDDSDDDLDFVLPDKSFSDDTETINESSASLGFENISNPDEEKSDIETSIDGFDDDLDFVLPDIESNLSDKNIVPENQDLPISDISAKADFSLQDKDLLSEHESRHSEASKSEQKITHASFDIDNQLASGNVSAPSDRIISDTDNISDHVSMAETKMNEAQKSSFSLDEFLTENSKQSDIYTEQLNTTASTPNIVSNISQPVSNDVNNEPSDNDIEQSTRNFEDYKLSNFNEIMGNSSNISMDQDSSSEHLSGASTDISPLDAFMTEQNDEAALAEGDNNVLSNISTVNNIMSSDNIQIESNTNTDTDTNSEPKHPQSRYSKELDKIREALTSDNIDISSLDQPIELDDYSDDENVGNNDYDDIISNVSTDNNKIEMNTQQEISTSQNASESSDDEDWEWEYVDEDGNPVSENGNDEDWEWEYVEDNEDTSNVDDHKK